VAPRRLAELARTPALWVLVLASGTTNATFNWGVTVGDVVRVVLLFYLMPLWAVLLARVLLGEPLRPAALLRIAMALLGAAIVLWPEGGGAAAAAQPGGVAGRAGRLHLRTEQRDAAPRSRAGPKPHARWPCSWAAPWWPAPRAWPCRRRAWCPACPRRPRLGCWACWAWALAFLVGNAALQFGAARLPANVTAVIMITEVLFASVSAALFGAGHITLPLALGGTLIVGATLLSARG
jgi:drug/metabolite transporter (DMT)-like permease